MVSSPRPQEPAFNDLPLVTRTQIINIINDCKALKSQLEEHGFEVKEFNVRVSSDLLPAIALRSVVELRSTVLVDDRLPIGTYKIAALAS